MEAVELCLLLKVDAAEMTNVTTKRLVLTQCVAIRAAAVLTPDAKLPTIDPSAFASPDFMVIPKLLVSFWVANQTANAKKLTPVAAENVLLYAVLMVYRAVEMPIVTELLINQSVPAQSDWMEIRTLLVLANLVERIRIAHRIKLVSTRFAKIRALSKTPVTLVQSAK